MEKITKLIGVSVATLQGNLKDFSYVAAAYKEIDDAQRYGIIQKKLRASSHSSQRMVTVALLSRGYKVEIRDIK